MLLGQYGLPQRARAVAPLPRVAQQAWPCQGRSKPDQALPPGSSFTGTDLSTSSCKRLLKSLAGSSPPSRSGSRGLFRGCSTPPSATCSPQSLGTAQSHSTWPAPAPGPKPWLQEHHLESSMVLFYSPKAIA